jgi:hypothetical protein
VAIDANLSAVLLGLFGLANTALLVYQAIRLNQVQKVVNGAKTAAERAAFSAGMAAERFRAPGADTGGSADSAQSH